MRKYLFVLAILLISTPLQADPACEEECNLNYWSCSDNCGPFGGALCEQQCVDAQNACLAHCSNCPSTREYTTSTITGRQATGRNGCYEDHIYFYSGKRYLEYLTSERRDTYRETTNCDGTKTTTLIGTGTISYYCWARDPIASCGNYAPNYLPICR